jgi:hypothetical protein
VTGFAFAAMASVEAESHASLHDIARRKC